MKTQVATRYGRMIRVDPEVRAAIEARREELQFGFDRSGLRHRVSAAEALRDLLHAPERPS